MNGGYPKWPLEVRSPRFPLRSLRVVEVASDEGAPLAGRSFAKLGADGVRRQPDPNAEPKAAIAVDVAKRVASNPAGFLDLVRNADLVVRANGRIQGLCGARGPLRSATDGRGQRIDVPQVEAGCYALAPELTG